MNAQPFPTNFAIWCAYEALYSHLWPFAYFFAVWTAFGAVGLLIAAPLESLAALLLVDDYALPEDLIVSLIQYVTLTGASVCLSVSWHRFIILNEPPGRPLPAPLVVVWDYTWRSLALFVAPIVAIILVVGFATPSLPSYDIINIAVSVAIAALAGFMLALPACAVGDQRVTFRASWQLARGSFFPLFLGLLACSLPFVAVNFVVDQLSADLGEGPIATHLPTYLMTLVDLMSTAVSAAFLSFAYLHLTERTPFERTPESYFE